MMSQKNFCSKLVIVVLILLLTLPVTTTTASFSEWEGLVLSSGRYQQLLPSQQQQPQQRDLTNVPDWNWTEAERMAMGVPSINFRDGYLTLIGISNAQGELAQHITFSSVTISGEPDQSTLERAWNSAAWGQMAERGEAPRVELLFNLPLYRRLTIEEIGKFIEKYDRLGGLTDAELTAMARVNEIRAENNRSYLQISRYGSIAARLYSMYMSVFGLGHNRGPYAINVGAWQGASGGVASAFNVGAVAGNGHMSGTLGAPASWYNSPGHRSYMLSGSSGMGLGGFAGFTYFYLASPNVVNPVQLYNAERLYREQGIPMRTTLGDNFNPFTRTWGETTQIDITEARLRFNSNRNIEDMEFIMRNGSQEDVGRLMLSLSNSPLMGAVVAGNTFGYSEQDVWLRVTGLTGGWDRNWSWNNWQPTTGTQRRQADIDFLTASFDGGNRSPQLRTPRDLELHRAALNLFFELFP